MRRLASDPQACLVQRAHLNQAHEQLCQVLHKIVAERDTDGDCLANVPLLRSFLERLVEHHHTENILINATQPDNLEIHLGVHLELASITADILHHAQRDGYLDHTLIEGLLVLLQRHIRTLDAEW